MVRGEAGPGFEKALVRKLEHAFARGTSPGQSAEISAYQWANACHELLDAGRIELLKFAVHHLSPTFPDLSYLKTLEAWFSQIPTGPSDFIPFDDDPSAELQIVRRAGCKKALLCFCASRGTLGLPLNLVHEWLGRLPVSLIYLKDFRDLSGACGYPPLGSDPTTSIAALRRITVDIGAINLYTMGVSAGGYAALRYGVELNARGVLSIAGDTDLTDTFNRHSHPSLVYAHVQREAPAYAENLRNRLVALGDGLRILLAYSADQPRDCRQAEALSGLPNIELWPVREYDGHNAVDPLIRRGQFLGLLLRLVGLETGGVHNCF
jgi:hypothetical protein